MPRFDEFESPVQKELRVFYVLDTSSSMTGAPIAALNDAMRDTVQELSKINESTADAAFKIAVLEFNSKVRWVTKGENGVEDIKDYYWEDLKEDGMTHLGDALTELNTGLSRNTMMKSPTGNKVPVIIFMSDGYPNGSDWRAPLQVLKESNKWYQQAIKVAFALGDDADTGVLAEVVGDPKAVIQTSNLEAFKSLIRVASVSASLAASTSKTSGAAVTGADVVQQAVGGGDGTDENGVVQVIDFEDVDIDLYVDPQSPVDINGLDDFS